MRYKIKESVYNAKTIKLTCKDVAGKTCKEELPIFTNNTPPKVLLVLIGEILTMGKRFQWFEKDKGNHNPKVQLVFQHFGRALKTIPQRAWAKLTRNYRNLLRAEFRNKV